MRRSRWLVAGGFVLVLAGAGTAFLLPSRSRHEIPQPASFGTLDPEVAQLVRGMIEEVEAEPGDIMRWIRLGMAYQGNEQPALAQRVYEIVTERAPRDSRGWFGLAKVSAALGEMDHAERAMRRAIELEDDYAPAHWRLGYWLFEQGEIDEAAQHFQRATHLEENEPAAWFGLARVHLARGDAANAATILEWLSKGPPPHGPYASQLLAQAYRQLGRTDDAETARLRGQGAEPDIRDPWDIEVAKLERGFGAHLDQAKRLLAYGRVEESLALLQRLRQRRPDDPAVPNNLATAYRALGRFDDSRSALREALALQPSFVQAHFGLALTTWADAQSNRRGDRIEQWASEALTHLDTTLELNASYAPAHMLRGEIFAALGNHQEAAAAFEQAYRLQPQQAPWLHDAAQARLALEEWSDAAAMLETVTRQAPTLAEAWSDFSIALARLGKRDEAQRALAKARGLAPTAEHVARAASIVEAMPQRKAVGP